MGASNDSLSFEQDIKPLFRETDRRSMDSHFDLWDYEDVRDNAEAILEMVASGRMPCDGAWPEEKTAVFQKWVQAGMPA